MLKKIKIEDYDSVKSWPYALAKQWIKKNLLPIGVNSYRSFQKYKSEGGYLPLHFPRDSKRYYQLRGTWVSYTDFFSNDIVLKNRFYNYRTVSKMAQKAGVKNSREYLIWKKDIDKAPAQPQYYYPEWIDWYTFLNTKREPKRMRAKPKLDEQKVLIIKHQLQMGVPAAQLAKLFGVSDMQIIRIKRGENWADVNL